MKCITAALSNDPSPLTVSWKMTSKAGNLAVKASVRLCCNRVCPPNGSCPNVEDVDNRPPVVWNDDIASAVVGTILSSICATLDVSAL